MRTITPANNPHAKQPVSPMSWAASIWGHRDLVYQLTKRDVVGRYKGSVIGLGWSFFHPLLMLSVYTFVFTVVFQARWDLSGEEQQPQFALLLFVGLIIHGLFAEVVNRAPGLIQTNVNYVKKVVFPLELLPVIVTKAALFHAFVSFLILFSVLFLMNGFVHLTALLFPIILIPFVLLIIGVAYFFASLGVFVKDINQAIGIVTTVMLFLSPIFYPVSALPERFQHLLFLNPITFIVEQQREVIVFGRAPDWNGFALYTAVALIIVWLGYYWFQRTRKGFADVL